MIEASSAIEKALVRERARRKLAEKLLEDKSRELFTSYEDLEKLLFDLKRNQRQLVQSEKMASIGILVSGVAHEINNPVGYVQSNFNTLAEYLPVFGEVLQMLKGLLNDEELFSCAKESRAELSQRLKELDVNYIVGDTESMIKESLDGLQRISEIVQGLRSFAHTESSEVALIDLNECLRNVYVLVNKSNDVCEITLDLQPLPKILGSDTKLGQVFLNLLVNSIQSIDSGSGKISLRSYQKGDNVVVEVEDNGCGIDDENIEKLFTPFFTTKPVGEGTGLGLSISFNIIEKMQGQLEVSSIVGEGTTFKVSLPITPEALGQAQEKTAQ